MASTAEECVLCCQEITFYATGPCDHPVCFICATRMRVLCETNDCPICRGNMPSVVFTLKLESYAVCKKSRKYESLMDKKYSIMFENPEIQSAFYELQGSSCKQCKEDFVSFDKLKEHMRRNHELHYCDLCEESLKIFTFERKCYSRTDLARHRRKGDPDNTSHRGHPLCQFCDKRFVDSDELFRHLRKIHYFCYFCDADGNNQYYINYASLATHFRKCHFVCDQGNCPNEEFTGAFKTELDLKAHIAKDHNKNKTKAEVKQAKVLDLEFPLAPRETVFGRQRNERNGQQRRRVNNDCIPIRQEEPEMESQSLDTDSRQEFPYLSVDDGCSAVKSAPIMNRNTAPNYSFSMKHDINSIDDYPTLGSTTEFTNVNSFKSNFSGSVQNNIAPAKSINAVQKANPKVNGNCTTKPNWKKSNTNFENEFPQLVERPNQPKMDSPKPVKTNRGNMGLDTILNNNTQSKPAATISDHFVTITKKSKKKSKQPNSKECVYSDDEEVKETDRFRQHAITDPGFPQPKVHLYDDSWHQKYSFKQNDFPALGADCNPPPVRKPPPGFNKRKPKKPPPGLGQPNEAPTPVSLSSIAQQILMPKSDSNCDNNNSTTVSYAFSKPRNYEQRNIKLIENIKELTGCTNSVPDDFKAISAQFLKGFVSAKTFHNKCLEILGLKGYMEAFPELVSLLPSIDKQQELLTVRNEFVGQQMGAINKSMKKVVSAVLSCDKCRQVLVGTDYRSHECCVVE